MFSKFKIFRQPEGTFNFNFTSVIQFEIIIIIINDRSDDNIIIIIIIHDRSDDNIIIIIIRCYQGRMKHFVQTFFDIVKIFNFVVIIELTKILYYRRPSGEPSETIRRPTCLIGGPSETDMLHRIPI